MQTATTIDGEIMCSRCRYDLRGLSVVGRCPECGESIIDSLEKWRLRQLPAELYPLQLCGRRFLWRLIEGAAASVLGFLLIVAVACAPTSAYAFKTRERRILLTLVCTSFVLQGLGV
jgi:hypothetical protein